MNCIFTKAYTNLFRLRMYSSFKAGLGAFDVKLKLHMLPSVLHVLHVTAVETHTT